MVSELRCQDKEGQLKQGDLDLNRNATNYRDNHKHIDAAKIILHFINVKH